MSRYRWPGLALAILLCVGNAHGEVRFENVTATAGPFPALESWGATARDYDGDGWIDLFVNNHRSRPYLLRNMGDGTFTDVTLSVDKSDVWINRPQADHHGAAWADLNNNGMADLWIATGTCCDAQVMINYGGYFYDEAIALDVHEDSGGRGVNLFEFSGDDYLDGSANQFNQSRSKEYMPSQGIFVNRNIQTGFNCGPRTNHIHVADFSTNGRAEILCVNENRLDKLYDIGDYATFGTPFVNISAAMPSIFRVPDSMVGDFDNNAQTDVLVLRGFLRQMGVGVFGNGSHLEGMFDVANSSRLVGSGFTFSGGERLRFTIHSENYGLNRISIGAMDVKPSAFSFTLDSSDPMVQIDSDIVHDPKLGHILYIGYNRVQKQWVVHGYGKHLNEGSARAYVEVRNLAQTALSNAQMFPDRVGDRPAAPTLLMNANGTFSDQASARGLDEPVSCSSVVVGDFDNDMDLDLYMTCRTAVSNEENLLYLNDGTGNFARQASQHGAEGPIGAAVADRAGTADSVVVADFDGDGFLDLYVVNGLSLQPDRYGAQSYLYRNLGNANRWLQLDLVAAEGPRDAIGAKVYVSTGGVTQLREQGNGYHRWSQDSHRLHFGLAQNDVVDLIRVEWPSGTVNEFVDVDASAIYTLTEGTGGLGAGSIETLVLGPVPDLPGPKPGQECGEPAYNLDFGPALLVWKDCDADTLHMRAKGGRVTDQKIRYSGSLIGSDAFAGVSAYRFDPDDSIDDSVPGRLGFDINVWFSNDNGLDIDLYGQHSLCLTLDTPENGYFLVGRERWASKGPIDLITMAPCGQLPSVSVQDLTLDEDAGVASVRVALSAPAGSASVFVDYATQDGTALAGQDYFPASGTIEIPPGETQAVVTVGIIDDNLPEADETFSLVLSNAVNAQLGRSIASVTIVDNDSQGEIDPCGAPAFDRATQRGIFVWRDCEAAGSEAVWEFRFTAGGDPLVFVYRGELTSAQPLSAERVWLQNNDLLDSQPGDGVVDYALRVKGSAVDGVRLKAPAGASACFNAATLPDDAAIHLGNARVPMPRSFDLATLGPCAEGD